ncbi:MAG: C25 family cysteine peptidase, partial [Gammaproteobacteria bacterium]
VGHGGIALWASENVFEGSDVGSLSPQASQPIVMTMNCLNGYFHFPYFDALGEALVKARQKGAIAAFSPSGLSLDAPAHLYHKALMAELTSGRHARLGDAVLAAQRTYAESGLFPELLAIYHLLGDPALQLQ